uniref:Cytochrome P450 n=1 Tax=Globodera rostochiensis TaxID=31243 RepID=A0A914I1W9_GLORO
MLFVPLLMLVSSFLLAFYNFYYKRRKLPPGPTPLPLVGNILTLIRKRPGEDAFLEWKRKYGPIYTYWLGEMPVVCVADYESIVQVFSKGGDEFTQRQIFVDFTHEFRGNIYGIFFINGDFWKEQRKFASTVFRNFGLYSNIMEKKILSELSLMFDRIDRKLAKSESNEINLIEDFHELVGLFDSAFKLAYEKSLGSLLSTLIVCYPNSTKTLPFFRERYDALMAVSRNLRNFFMSRIEKRAEQINFKSSDYGDFVEAFLKEKERLDATDIGHSFSLDQLWNVCMDLWIAGQETSSTIIAWGFAHLLHNPQSLARLYDELERVVGNDRRLITIADKQSLPYTNATINEFLRISNMVVQNAYRRVFVDVNIGNFRIPKGTCILPQISVVLADDDVFADPKIFRPERFLDEKGNFVKCEKLIPFSVGRRKCFAESMAKMEIFLFTANIVNQYRISASKVLPSIKREMGITIHCPKFECRVEKRIND